MFVGFIGFVGFVEFIGFIGLTYALTSTFALVFWLVQDNVLFVIKEFCERDGRSNYSLK